MNWPEDPVWLLTAGIVAVAMALGLPLLVLLVGARVDRDLGSRSRRRAIEILVAFRDRGVTVFNDPGDISLLGQMRDRKLVEVEFHGGATHIIGAASILRLRTPGNDLLALYGERGMALRLVKAVQIGGALVTGWMPRLWGWVAGEA